MNLPASPLALAVVGHTNAGKTSLLRTLARRREFGEVSDRPGTTRHAEAIALMLDGQPVLSFIDTPGLEDPIGLLTVLQAGLQGPGPGPGPRPSPPERIQAFLAGPLATGDFEQEAKVLRAAGGVAALLHVIDCREPVLPKYRSEMEILSWCARPVLPVLNFCEAAGARAADWTAALADYGLHAVLRFDAVAPFVGAELRLYEALKTLVPAHAERFDELLEFLALERLDRRAASLAVLAELLLQAASLRHQAPRRTLDDANARAALVTGLHEALSRRSRAAVAQWLEIHAFSPEDAELVLAPFHDGRWEADLFNPEHLRRAGQALGAGAALGAGIGLAADLALAGLSLGTGTAIGAAIGGGLSQGWTAPARHLARRLRGLAELAIEDAALALLARQMLTLLLQLERRGHAAVQPVRIGAPADTEAADARPLLAALRPARAHPAWAEPSAGDRRRSAAQAAVLAALRRQLATNEGPPGGP